MNNQELTKKLEHMEKDMLECLDYATHALTYTGKLIQHCRELITMVKSHNLAPQQEEQWLETGKT